MKYEDLLNKIDNLEYSGGKDLSVIKESLRGDLFAVFSAQNYSKDKLWKIAWEYGHENGLSSVAHLFARLVDLCAS